MRRILCAALVVLVAPASIHATPGELDPSFGGFGTGGFIESLQFGGSGAFAGARGAALDAHGRLVLAGAAEGKLRVQRRGVPRFSERQTVDVVLDVGQSAAAANDVAIGPDGKIVVVGTVNLPEVGSEMAVARLNSDLTPDLTFGTNGSVIVDFGGLGGGSGQSVAVQSDNKIVVGGYDNEQTAVARLDVNGALDSGFHLDGRWSEHDMGQVVDIEIQDDQKILLVGSDFDAGYEAMIVRLNVDGSPDGDFDGDGRLDIGFGSSVSAKAAALGPNGEIALVGGGEDEVVARILPNGDLDDGFDDDGRVSLPDFFGSVHEVAVQRDGKLLVVGSIAEAADPRPLDAAFYLLRYETDATLDPTFGTGGEVVTFFPAPFDAIGAVAAAIVQPDGMLLLAGQKNVARYRWDGSLDAGGIASVGFHPRHAGSEVAALGVQADGKLVAAGKAYVSDYEMALARFSADGAGLDPGFGTDASGRTLHGSTGPNEEIRALAFDDGDIAVVGESIVDTPRFLIGRFEQTGAPDAGCATTGFAAVDFEGSEASGYAAYVREGDGRVYAAGRARGSGEDYALVRLTDGCTIDTVGSITPDLYRTKTNLGFDDIATGVVAQSFGAVVSGTSGGNAVLFRQATTRLGTLLLDTGFGTDGFATIDTGYDENAAALTEQTDGSLLVAGTVDRGETSDFFVARLNLHGQPDLEFGNAGVAFADFNGIDVAHAVDVRGDGTIAVAGCTTAPTGVELAVALFDVDGELDTGFDGSGKVTLALGTDDEACAHAVTFFRNDSVVIGGYASAASVRQYVLVAFETNIDTSVSTTTTTTTTTTTVTTTTQSTTTTTTDSTTTTQLVTTTTSAATTSTSANTTTTSLSTTTTAPTTTLSTTTTTLAGTECGDPNGDDAITASDALFVLRAAVGSVSCATCVCDTDDSGAITSPDALRVLRVAVGAAAALDCPTTCLLGGT